MARTRQQQQAAAAAARQWRRAELRLLLDAWQRVLRYPQTRYETSDELEHRIYTRFQLLAKSQRAAANAMTPRTAGDVALTTQRLKRAFLFISAYNQTHCNRSSSTTAAPASPRTSASPAEPLSTTAPSTRCRSWFQLQPQERRGVLETAQRGRRAAPFVDMDRAMYGTMQTIMTHTLAQLERRRRSRSPSRSDGASASDREAPSGASSSPESGTPVLLLHSAATAPWSLLEVRRLLHAWHETLADPHRARVHSDAYLTALYERFVDSCEGSTPRCNASLRTKKTALTRFGALVRDLDARTAAPLDWFAMTPAQRTQLLHELGHTRESATELDPALFALLELNLALEDDAYAKASSLSATTAASARELRRTAERPVRVAVGQDERWTQHSQVNDTVDSDPRGDSCSTDESRGATATPDSVDKVPQPKTVDHDSVGKSRSCQCRERAKSSESQPQLQCSRSKRLRVDADLFVVLDILEREAVRLRGMFQDAADARAGDTSERDRLRIAVERERSAHAHAAAAWQSERAALQDEIAQLRRLSRRGLVRRREEH